MKTKMKFNTSFRNILIKFTIIFYAWMILWAKFESLVKWTYGIYYWGVFFSLHFFLATFFIFYIVNKDKNNGITVEGVSQLGLFVGGIMIIGFVIEDFFAITFAGLFDPINGINGSVAGISYYDPDLSYYVEAMFPTGYFQINLFKIPWAYIYLPVFGGILILTGAKIDRIKIKKN